MPRGRFTNRPASKLLSEAGSGSNLLGAREDDLRAKPRCAVLQFELGGVQIGDRLDQTEPEAAARAGAARVEEALVQMSLRGLAECRPGSFPRGLQRRVGLAQAILHRPEVLLLDEPDAGLDPMEARQIRAALEVLNAGGMTIVLCTLSLGEVTRACSLMGVLAHGALVFYGLGEARGASWRDPAALQRLYGALAPSRGAVA